MKVALDTGGIIAALAGFFLGLVDLRVALNRHHFVLKGLIKRRCSCVLWRALAMLTSDRAATGKSNRNCAALWNCHD
ncbi:MAG: hypothetical protein ACJ0GQ_01200 [Parasynechococcus sp.]